MLVTLAVDDKHRWRREGCVEGGAVFRNGGRQMKGEGDDDSARSQQRSNEEY